MAISELNRQEIEKRVYKELDKTTGAKRVISTDNSGRSSNNSVFGETITGKRIADVSGQFQLL